MAGISISFDDAMTEALKSALVVNRTHNLDITFDRAKNAPPGQLVLGMYAPYGVNGWGPGWTLAVGTLRELRDYVATLEQLISEAEQALHARKGDVPP